MSIFLNEIVSGHLAIGSGRPAGEEPARTAEQPRPELVDPPVFGLGSAFSDLNFSTSDASEQEPNIAALPGGGYVVTWYASDGTGSRIYQQRFDAAHDKVGVESVVDIGGGTAFSPHASDFGDGYVVTWSQRNGTTSLDIYARVFDGTGQAVTGPFIVHAPTAQNQQQATVEDIAGGKFVIAWMSSGQDGSGQGIYARIFDANGTAVGPEFLVNVTTAGDQSSPSVVKVSGGFVVLWDAADSTNGFDVMGRRFSDTGQTLGDEFKVNQYDIGFQYASRATALPDGGFLVTWTAETSSQTAVEIYARQYAADGTPKGDEFRVNEAIEGGQTFSSVVVLDDGGYLIVWNNHTNSENPGTYARRYDASGAPLTGEVRLGPTSFQFDAVQIAADTLVIVSNGDAGLVRYVITLQGPNIINGGDLPDALNGTNEEDVLNGLGGNDTLSGGPGDDRLNGGGGDGDVAVFTAPAVAGARLEIVQDPANPAITLVRQVLGGVTELLFRVSVAEDGVRVQGLNSAASLGADLLQGVERIRFQIGEGATGDQVFTMLTPTTTDDLLDLSGQPQIQASTGQGNDGIFVGATFDEGDQVDGGADVDTLALQGNYADLKLGSVAAIEVVLLASGSDTRFGDTAGNFYDYRLTTRDTNVAAGEILTVVATSLRPGEDLVFDGSAETDGSFRIFAGAGVDNLTGGGGGDGFFFGADANLGPADKVVGGGGSDSLALRGNYALTFSEDSMSGVEVLVFLSGLDNQYGGPIVPAGFDYDVTMANGNVAAGQLMEVIAAGLAVTETFVFDGRTEVDGAFRIISGAGADTVFGSQNGDTIAGGLGGDRLDGAGGADTYVYRAMADSTAGSVDTLTLGAGDRIDLSFIDANGLDVDGNQAFTFIGSGAFTNASGQLRAYQSGDVWVIEADLDGNSVADMVIQAISVDPITAGDFIP